MKRNSLVTLAALAGLATLLAASSASAQRFSLDGGPGPGVPPLVSPSIVAPLIDNTDILTAGPVGGPPVLFTAGAALGFPPPAYPSADELDAISYGGPVVGPGAMLFAVDWLTAGAAGGVPPDVLTEVFVAQAPADIYNAPGGGFNTLVINQDALGLIPPIPAGTPFMGFFNDSIDALDLATGAPAPGFPVFSVGAVNTLGVSGADVLAPGPVVATPAAVLGLLPTDDIDALHLNNTNGDIIFSLAPGSPSLGAVPNPACPGLPVPCSPADVFIAPGGAGPFVLFIGAAAAGLLAADNIEGLAFPPPPAPVPSLSATGLGILSALVIAATWAVRRRRHLD